MLTIGSPTQIAANLTAEGITTKAWTTQEGQARSGTRIDKKYLHKLLRNRIYLGELSHKGSWYPGAHPPIIQQELWDKVHAVLAKDSHARSAAQDTALMRALGLAHHWQRLLDEQRMASVTEIADAEGVDVTQVRRVIRLTLLAPEVVERLAGSTGAVLEKVMRRPWSSSWVVQRLALADASSGSSLARLTQFRHLQRRSGRRQANIRREAADCASEASIIAAQLLSNAAEETR
jgi:hypothetical protein